MKLQNNRKSQSKTSKRPSSNSLKPNLFIKVMEEIITTLICKHGQALNGRHVVQVIEL